MILMPCIFKKYNNRARKWNDISWNYSDKDIHFNSMIPMLLIDLKSFFLQRHWITLQFNWTMTGIFLVRCWRSLAGAATFCIHSFNIFSATFAKSDFYEVLLCTEICFSVNWFKSTDFPQTVFCDLVEEVLLTYAFLCLACLAPVNRNA